MQQCDEVETNYFERMRKNLNEWNTSSNLKDAWEVQKSSKYEKAVKSDLW
jgi:hypothetical protein